jgi:hypothetical protein
MLDQLLSIETDNIDLDPSAELHAEILESSK